MRHSTSSQSKHHLVLRRYRNISYFVATVGCFVGLQILKNLTASAQTSPSLYSNTGNNELSRSISNISFEITPLSISCVVILVMVFMFLLQPVFIHFSQSPNSTTISPTPLLNINTSSNRILNTPNFHDLKPHQFPSIDRLIFTDQSIISTTLHSLESASEIQLLPLSSQSLTQVIERSMAEIIVLMDNNMRLDSLDMTLGIRYLWDQHLDVVKPKSLSPEIVEKREDHDSKNSYPELYQFLDSILSVRNITSSMPYHESSGRNKLSSSHSVNSSHSVSSSHGDKCYIVRRSVLFSLLKRWEWSQIDSKYKNEKIQVERLYTVIGMS